MSQYLIRESLMTYKLKVMEAKVFYINLPSRA